MKFLSPLRYPGGKSSLRKLLIDVIEANELRGCEYFEPYAGGAGAALGLLRENVVSRIHLNDADFRIYALWKAILDHNDAFIDLVKKSSLTIQEWRKQKVISESSQLSSILELGFSTFYLNRCNRSGVLGAGPIGGYAQNGKWRLDARFNRESLTARILAIGSMKNRITISRLDALDFLKSDLPKGKTRSKVLVYLDPPYVDQARRLYLNFYRKKDHAIVATYLKNQKILSWVMSYDDCELVRTLYSQKCSVSNIPVKYSLNRKRVSNELLIAPNQVIVPNESSNTNASYGANVGGSQ